MKTVEELAREADIEFGDFQWIAYDTDLQRFHDLAIAQYREALLAGVGEAVGWVGDNSGCFIRNVGQRSVSGNGLYTADQMAAAVAIERERCAKVVEEFPHDQLGCLDEVAAAIRGQR